MRKFVTRLIKLFVDLILGRLTKRRLYELFWGRLITVRINNLKRLIDQQDAKGLDLYDGLKKNEHKKLINAKHSLVTYLVRMDSASGDQQTLADTSAKLTSYKERLCIDVNELRGKTVLEVGSGHAAALSNCEISELVNVDPLMNIYIKYIKGFPDLIPDTVFLKSDAESLPFEDNRFDFIICINALDHFNDARKATVEMGRVLQPGGKLFLNVDCKNRLNVRIRKRVGHPYSFTPAKLQELFEPTCLNVTFEQSFDIGPSHTMHFIKE